MTAAVTVKRKRPRRSFFFPPAHLTHDLAGQYHGGMSEHPIIDILGRWPSRKELAEDIGKGVIVVHRWHQRKSIPAEYDLCLIEAASRRGIGLSLEDLAEARQQVRLGR